MFKIILFFLLFIHGNQATRVDNICSSKHLKRVFLRLGESGVLTAYNISTFDNSFSGNCQIEIVTCSSCILSLTFKYLNLKCYGGFEIHSKKPSRGEYVWVMEPPYTNVSGQFFCKFLPSLELEVPERGSSYRSKTRTVRIVTVYSQVHIHAFTVEYKSERNRQFFFGTPQLLPNVNLTRGVISSPFFPETYPRDLVNEYVISCLTHSSKDSKTDSNCRIHLVFTDFQLALSSAVEFYDGNRRVDVISGSEFRPPIIISNSNSLIVRFYASGATNAGFKALFSFISGDNAEKTKKPSTDCGGLVENFGGTITMMNMVGIEKKLYDCIWLIRPLKNLFNVKTHLYLKIIAFSNFDKDCELEVRQGLTSDSPILERLYNSAPENTKEYIVPLETGYYVNLKASFGPNSHLAIAYASFSYNQCFAFSDFFCQNFRCISKKLNCDGFNHCGDNSDEPAVCFREWDLAHGTSRWYSHTPNYYFPKMKAYSDLQTASLVFLFSLVGFLFLAALLTIFLYRIGTKARRQRALQEQLQTFSEIQGGVWSEVFSDVMSDVVYMEEMVIDDPPGYEPPPNYEDILKVKCLGSENSNRKVSQIRSENTSTIVQEQISSENGPKKKLPTDEVKFLEIDLNIQDLSSKYFKNKKSTKALVRSDPESFTGSMDSERSREESRRSNLNLEIPDPTNSMTVPNTY